MCAFYLEGFFFSPKNSKKGTPEIMQRMHIVGMATLTTQSHILIMILQLYEPMGFFFFSMGQVFRSGPVSGPEERRPARHHHYCQVGLLSL